MAGPNSQNQYTPQAVVLDGGLDFITPKVSVQGGSLSGCLNFERTDVAGYTRIHGYEPYDGGSLASLCYTSTAVLTGVATGGTTLHLRDDVWITEYSGETTTGVSFGTIVAIDGSSVTVTVVNFDEWRYLLYLLGTASPVTINANSGTFTATGASAYSAGTTAAEETTARNSLYKSISSIVTLPGIAANPIIGLVGYKDKLYAVKDLYDVAFSSGSSEVHAGETIKCHAQPSITAQVLEVEVESGTWAGSDAAGIITVAVDTLPTGSYDIVRSPSDVTNAFSLSNVSATHKTKYAGLYVSNNYWQSDDSGLPQYWSFIHTGYTLSFIQGSAWGPPRLPDRGVFSQYETPPLLSGNVSGDVTFTDPTEVAPVDTWTYAGSTEEDALAHGDGLSKYTKLKYTKKNSAPGYMKLASFGDLTAITGDANAVIEGIELIVKWNRWDTEHTNINTGGIKAHGTIGIELQSGGTTIAGAQFKSIGTDDLGGAGVNSDNQFTETTFGGTDDLWQLTAATMKTAIAGGIGVRIIPTADINTFVDANNVAYQHPDVSYKFYYVELRVHFSTQVDHYYFWNGTDDATTTITDYYVSSGEWANGDAAGYIQISEVVPVSPSTRNYVSSGDEIRTAPGGNGLLIAKLDGSPAYNGLAPSNKLESANSRYQFTVNNFYGDEAYDSIFGVSGADRAFSWDGFYLTKIYTQPDASKDMPRHVSSHQNHLALGYRSGSVMLSVVGEPRNFDGVAGATEISTGDPVTGFAKMQGTTLGIFCKGSVHGLVGTSADNFSMSVLNPYEGAIEYTVADVGRPIYCSYKGISFFDQTAAYGDFAGRRLSYSVSPWLLPRLQGAASPLQMNAAAGAPLVAYAHRTSNQYRLVFGDGYCLTMTLVGAEQLPMFTIQAYYLYGNAEEGYKGILVPRAEASWIDSSGVEHVHMSHYSRAVPLSSYCVYELGKSWTFDGNGIPAYVISNQNFFGSPFNYDNVRKLRLHGTSYGYAPVSVYVDKNYNDNTTMTYSGRQAVVCSLPRETAASLEAEQTPYTTMGDVATRARGFSMRFMSYATDSQPAGVSDPVNAAVSPPFVMQAVLVQHTENKGDV